jgi:OmcA/MtrC family decaheme c-type cytochrome
VDFENMIHKIHRGAELPSVEAGDPYQIIGFRQSVHDFSTVVFPQPVQNCATCHSGSDGDRWMTPSRKACTSCHDRTSFVDPPPDGYTLHPGGDFSDDTQCGVCHRPSGGLSGVADVHMTPSTDPARPDFVLAIDAVTNTAPGQAPIIDFTATVNGQGLDIGATPLNTLRVTVAGPTTDYAGYQQATIQGGGASGAPTAIDAAAGKFRYQLPAAAAIPAGATGTFGFALEGYYQPAGGARVAAFNPIAFAPVTDSSAEARRTVAYQAGCDSCHDELGAHGGQRRNVEYCVMCHNPNTTGAGRVARFEGTTVVAPPVNLRVMIHKIHRGEDLSQPYVLGLYPPPNRDNPGGTQHDFAHTRYPGDLRACWSCHPGGTTELPLATGLLPTRSEILTCLEPSGDDGDDYCDDRSSTDVFTLPTASVCGSCHDSPESAAHAEVMTSSSGVESCAACHGPGSVFDPAKSHRLDP